jgi:hypothetical protein
MAAKKALEIGRTFGQDNMAKYIAYTWFLYNSQRRTKIEEWKELRNYVFATDTTTTSNQSLPWKNKTTIPKLCQIRDNLHSNYISALFPNDDWLKWIAYSEQDATKAKREAIEAYMSNKTREGGYRPVMSTLLYDFIDYGNVFATVDFENSYREDDEGNRVIDYIGPVARRISPLDIVFNPLAASFKDSFKIIRSLKTIGELRGMALDQPDDAYLVQALNRRDKMIEDCRGYGFENLDKDEGMLVDGFGSYGDYLQSGVVELLEFWGDYHDESSGELTRGRVITVIDRMWMIRNEPIPSWFGSAPIFHVGWRTRPDNLWAMGPLDNLVGMQYRIDHLENLKADAMDLAVLPPLLISGEVEEFKYGPGVEIHIDENGGVAELGKNVQWVIASENQIQAIEQRMELYAGAPREAMGVRTAGEKTAYEVQQLQNAASRIFQEKITTFETELSEPLLNSMLETARRNLQQQDVVRSLDDDLGVTQFLTITKEDITASGVIRPVGARHFAANAQMLQNLTSLFNSTLGQMVAPHTSSVNMAKLLEDVFGVQRFELFKPNVAIFEQQETQRLVNQAQEGLQVEQKQPPPPGLTGAV